MKKTFLEKKRMLLSMLTLVAFLFVGMGSAAAQSEASDLERLQARVATISQTIQNAPEGAKKDYYTDLVVYYNAIIEDVENNNVPFTRAVRSNFSLMPKGPNNQTITSDVPRGKNTTASMQEF